MTPATIDLRLTRTDRPCPNCGALLYRVLQIGTTSTGSQVGQILGPTCRSCEANGMKLLKETCSMATRTEKILCKFCPKFVMRFYADISPPLTYSRFFLIASHYQEAHPIEYQRIMHYLDQEIIVQEEVPGGQTLPEA